MKLPRLLLGAGVSVRMSKRPWHGRTVANKPLRAPSCRFVRLHITWHQKYSSDWTAYEQRQPYTMSIHAVHAYEYEYVYMGIPAQLVMSQAQSSENNEHDDTRRIKRRKDTARNDARLQR